MSVLIEKIYESDKSGEKTVVLWVSRHPPLDAQIKMLEEKLENIVVYQLVGVIPNAEFVIEKARELKAKYIVPVLPLSMIARLAELSRNGEFVILMARMTNILTTRNIEEAKKMLEENPDRRTISTYADGYIRVFEFERYEKLIKIELITEPF
jgi:hypothetical protein